MTAKYKQSAQEVIPEDETFSSFREVLRKLDVMSSSAAEKGILFEKLVKAFLEQDKAQSERFDKVWLWTEWPGNQNRHDTGIDLVARERVNGDLVAIQCKFFVPTAAITLEQLNKFLGAYSTDQFASGIFVSTSENWTRNAENALDDRIAKPVVRWGQSVFEDSSIDWTRFSLSRPQILKRQEQKSLREYQQDALNDVEAGFKEHDRGKLIMACGSGKTFTALRIAEHLVGTDGSVLFLTPSISLLSQSLTDWTKDSDLPLTTIPVCSDASVKGALGTDDDEDSAEIRIYDSPLPASTNHVDLVKRFEQASKRTAMTAVFSTYQSLDVVSEAQRNGLPPFDLIICDEAHRTTGASLGVNNESAFQRVHSNDNVNGVKRLYMTATPRIYDDNVRQRATENRVMLASMDDENIYGPEFHRLGFGKAVEMDILTDYKVVILDIDQEQVGVDLADLLADSDTEINITDSARMIGCWNGLRKRGSDEDLFLGDEQPAKRAVAFSNSIAASAAFEKKLPTVIASCINTGSQDAQAVPLLCEVKHVDGRQNALSRSENLAWLKEEPEGGTCKILTNARCLTEGIDVPALDAILFMQPRRSKIDVVQAVGRVMRKSPGKRMGYIILPIARAPHADAQKTVSSSAYEVVWDVINAISAHDDRFEAKVNQLKLQSQSGLPDPANIFGGSGMGTQGQENENPGVGEYLEAARAGNSEAGALDETPAVAEVGEPTDDSSQETGPANGVDNAALQAGAGSMTIDVPTSAKEDYAQRYLPFIFDGSPELQDAILARLVDRYSTPRYWEQWADKVREIAINHESRIRALLHNRKSGVRPVFDEFLSGLRGNLNDDISEDEAIGMLSQHLVMKPVFDALFADYDFAGRNPVSLAMQSMIDALADWGLERETAGLEDFYRDVRIRVEGITTAEGKQEIIKELYERFFKGALSDEVFKSLGIAYTPVEVVDYIIKSVEDILNKDFDASLSDEGVHIIDPFVGTGTFITRLLQLGFIKPEDLRRKYREEIHANELNLLAYYVATMNIEATYHELAKSEQYEPFPGIVLTDTFQAYERKDKSLDDMLMPSNNERIERQKNLDIRVVISNPPWSRTNNREYPTNKDRVRSSYARLSNIQRLNALYDPYIGAIRLWSDWIHEGDRGGVIGLVTNGGFIEANSFDGFRKTVADEFDEIYCYNLRGDQRTSGEKSRQEGGKIFGSSSRAGVAIPLLVKKPTGEADRRSRQAKPTGEADRRSRQAKPTGEADRRSRQVANILYRDIGDHLTREQKLSIVGSGSLKTTEWTTITPDEHGDWVNQRLDIFHNLHPLVSSDAPDEVSVPVFKNRTQGIVTSRDAWCYNSSVAKLRSNIRRSISFYNSEVSKLHKDFLGHHIKLSDSKSFVRHNPKEFHWGYRNYGHAARNEHYEISENNFRRGIYRPFCKQHLYFSRQLNHDVTDFISIFPRQDSQNIGIYIRGHGPTPFSNIMTDGVTDVALAGSWNGSSTYYPRYRYIPAQVLNQPNAELERVSNINPVFTEHCNTLYEVQSITEDDVFYYTYGVLHSEQYRKTFANDLSKERARIPLASTAKDFFAFAEAGRRLADLHVNYESVEPHPSIKEVHSQSWKPKAKDAYRVQKMKYAGKRPNLDKTTIIYNAGITLTGIPEKAHEYQLGTRSALDWLIDRYQVKTHKASGITNDPNDWAIEHGEPRYILDLIKRVTTVSVETVNIVKGLPELPI